MFCCSFKKKRNKNQSLWESISIPTSNQKLVNFHRAHLLVRALVWSRFLDWGPSLNDSRATQL